MKSKTIFKKIRCPCCFNRLRFKSNQLFCKNNHKFSFKNNIPSLIAENDVEFLNIWEERAKVNSVSVAPVESKKYNLLGSLARRELIKIILPRTSGNSIVEVGCGKGQFLQVLEKINRYDEIWGVDYSYQMLLNNTFKSQKARMDAHNLAFADKSFDISLMITVLMHNRSISNIVKELTRISKKYIILQEGDSTLIPRYFHKKHIFIRDIKYYEKEFSKYGWSLIYNYKRRALPLNFVVKNLTGLTFLISSLSWMVFKKNE